MMLDELSNKILMAAYNEAKKSKHEYLTPEHILYSSTFFKESLEILQNSGGDIESLKTYLIEFLQTKIPVTDDIEPAQTIGVNNVIKSAAAHCYSAGKNIVHIGDILISIMNEEESFARYFMMKSGITKLDLLNYVSHGFYYEQEHDAIVPVEKEIEDDGYEEYENKKSKSFLESYTVDLVEKAKEGRIDPLVGRNDIVKRTLQVLARRVKNNPIHVGDPGVGKTAITEGIASIVAEGRAPKILKNCYIYSLDMGLLIAGTKYRGDFEDRIKKLLAELEKLENAIVYIDEIHTVVGAGAVSGGSMDASNILKPFLASGKLKFIGSTTYEEYKKYFEKDRALSRRFQKIEILEPSEEETVDILNGLKVKYEEFHNVKYSEEAIKLAVELSSKYINDKCLPDKAIDVIDETAANIRLDSEDTEDFITITGKDIEETVSLMAKVPRQSVSVNEVEILKELDGIIKKELFGQDIAISTVVNAIKRSRAGFHDGDKPISSLLFVGKTGVGKTELARLLAKSLSMKLIRFDMSEYQEKHTVARLIGAPPGYVGYEEGGLMTEEIRKTPYCVLLLDEIEKAHPDIFNVLLQVMDYATLTDNTGKKTDFKNVIIIMTSNAGAREVGKDLIGFEKRNMDEDVIKREVDRVFSPEFRNRLDDVVVFNPISMDMAIKIANKEIKKFSDKLNEKNITISVTNKCYKWFAEKGLSSIYGAREIQRLVQEKVKNYFVDEVLFGSFKDGGAAEIDMKNDEIKITRKDKRKKNASI